MGPRRGPGAAALSLLAAALAVLLPRAAVGQGLLYPERLAAGELAMAELFQSFEEAMSFLPVEVGGRRQPTMRGTNGRKRGHTGGGSDPFSTADKLAQLQLAAYYIAGAPDAFPACRSGGDEGNPNATFTPRRPDCNNFVPAARDQRMCSTCVSTAVAAALQIAAASTMQEPVERWRVNAASLHYCSKALVGFRTCPIGWDISEALGTVLDAQPSIVRPDSCLWSVPELSDPTREVGVASWVDICGRADQAMQNCSLTNSTGHFLTCTYKPLVTFHDIQRHVRRHGAVISRITIPDDFEGQFANASGLLGEEAQPYHNTSTKAKYGHAVVIVGYNNSARTWTILNSWGDSSSSPNRKGTTADGTFRITMGLLGVGDQAYGVECEPAPRSPADPHEARPWQRRDSKPLEFLQESDRANLNTSCHLHRFNASTDTPSSLVDHFGLGMLDFVHDNAGAVPLQNITYNFSDSLSQNELQDVLDTANSLLRPAGGIQPLVQCSRYDDVGKESVLRCATNATDCTRLGNGTENCALHYSAYDLSALADGTALRICNLSTNAFYRTAHFSEAKASQRRALRDILRALGEEDAAVPEYYCSWDMLPHLRVSNCTNGTWVTSITVQDPQANAATKTSLTMMMSDALLQPLLRLERLERLELFWLDGPLPPQLGALKHITTMDIGYHCAWGGLPANWLDGWASIVDLSVCAYSNDDISAPQKFADHDCGVNGSVPERWSKAAGSGNLKTLNLSSNQFADELPSLAGLHALAALRLSSNRWRGTLPRSWAKELRSIKELYLSDNHDLVGLVPHEWSAMADTLKLANFSNTGLRGCLPHEFTKLYKNRTTILQSRYALASRSRRFSGTRDRDMRPGAYMRRGAPDMRPDMQIGLGDITIGEQGRYRYVYGRVSTVWYDETNITGLCELEAPERQRRERDQVEAIMVTTFTKVFSYESGVTELASVARHFGNASTSYISYDNMLNWVAKGLDEQRSITFKDKGYGSANDDHSITVNTRVDTTDGVAYVTSIYAQGVVYNLAHIGDLVSKLPGLEELHIHQCRLAETSDAQLPADLAKLAGERLKVLQIRSSDVAGTLPAQWGSWTTLKELDLHFNRLTGQLPPSWGQMQSLQRLDLASNRLAGPLPPEWQGMRSLALGRGTDGNEWTLDLSDNDGLNGTLPDAWGGNGSSMPDNISFALSSTGLAGTIPPSYKRFGNLQLHVTHVTGCIPPGVDVDGLDDGPCAFTETQTVKQLCVMLEAVYGSTEALDSWLTLSKGATSYCRNKTGIQCDADGRVTELDLPALRLNVTKGTQLNTTTLFAALSGLPYLQTLVASKMRLAGPLPALPVALPGGNGTSLGKLRVIDLSGNPEITGGLPPSWQALQDLETLDLSGCSGVTGTLPEEWAALQSLLVLRAANTGISGQLPPMYGLLRSLQELDVSNARLSGPPVPPAWLDVLQMQAAAKAGGGPSQSQAVQEGTATPAAADSSPTVFLTRLKVLRLANNRFSGTLERELSRLPALRILDLSAAKGSGNITGTLPASLAIASQLQELSLSGQGLSGGLPIQWSTLSSLEKLDLARNQLSGPLPSTWTGMKRLKKLDLSGNAGLTGSVPPSWLQLQWCSKVLLLNGTGVSGC